MSFNFQKLKSPIGLLYLVAKDKNLLAIIFEKNWAKFKKDSLGIVELETPILARTKKQLTEYFKGERKIFNLPYELKGTVFQKKVWSALSMIPFGKTKSYKEQAILIKSPKAARAIGRADGLNPLCIILPCHRVIGSSGALTGFAGGLEAKKFLLNLEGADIKS